MHVYVWHVQTLLTELVRLRRLYESREAQFTAESDHCQGQLEQLLKLNSAKDAVYAHEKDALIVGAHCSVEVRLDVEVDGSVWVAM